MTCRDFIAFLDDYLAGQLPSDAQGTFRNHLSRCTDCRNYLDSYRRTVELGKQAFELVDEDVSAAAVPESMIRAVLSATSRARR